MTLVWTAYEPPFQQRLFHILGGTAALLCDVTWALYHHFCALPLWTTSLGSLCSPSALLTRILENRRNIGSFRHECHPRKGHLNENKESIFLLSGLSYPKKVRFLACMVLLWGCRDDSAVRHPQCSYRVLEFQSQHPYGISRLPVTPIPRDPIPSSDLLLLSAGTKEVGPHTWLPFVWFEPGFQAASGWPWSWHRLEDNLELLIYLLPKVAAVYDYAHSTWLQSKLSEKDVGSYNHEIFIKAKGIVIAGAGAELRNCTTLWFWWSCQGTCSVVSLKL